MTIRKITDVFKVINDVMDGYVLGLFRWWIDLKIKHCQLKLGILYIIVL